MSTSERPISLPAAGKPVDHPVLAGKPVDHPVLAGPHVVGTINGLLRINEPLAPILAVEDISGLDQDACLDRADRAFGGLRSLGRLSALQVWIAGEALSRARDMAKHGTWTATLRSRKIAEPTVRQAIRVFQAFPDPAILPSQITQAKIDAGIVRPRLSKDAAVVGVTALANSLPDGQNLNVLPTAGGGSPSDQAGDGPIQGGEAEGHDESHHAADAQDDDVEDGDNGGFAGVGVGNLELDVEPVDKPISGTAAPKWFEGEPSGDLGQGYIWQVFPAGEDVRVVWAPISSMTDRFVSTTTGLKYAREEGIYRTRRDALLGKSRLLNDKVEQLQADLNQASKSLARVNELLGDD